jgi:cardiolipin synthase
MTPSNAEVHLGHDFFLLLTVIVYGLAILNCVRIVSQNLNPQTALAWILVNLAFPYVGVPLYYLIGQNRLRTYSRKRIKSETRLSYIKNLKFAPEPTEFRDVGPHYDLFHRVLARINPSFQPRPCDIELLIDGESTFAAIFAGIAAARHYIFVQYYILRSDRLGRQFKDLLIQKAKEGVAIYLIFDDIGSFGLSRNYVHELKHHGVQVARFLPLTFPGTLQVNFRNHRKLVLCDGTVAFTGGLNVGDEYLGGKHMPYWRDTHLKIQGAAVRALADIFLTDWFFAAKKRIKVAPLKLTGEAAEGAAPQGPGLCQAQVVPFGPNDKDFVGILVFMQLIAAAQKRLWIATPYFVPDAGLERLLELAVLRGVDVRVLIPMKSDHHLVYWVSLSYAHELRARGIKFFLYTKGFMHQKLIVLDDSVAVLGTSNFDNRTFFLNFETVVIVHSSDFNQQCATVLERDFRDAAALDFTSSPWSTAYGFKARLARLLAPLM